MTDSEGADTQTGYKTIRSKLPNIKGSYGALYYTDATAGNYLSTSGL